MTVIDLGELTDSPAELSVPAGRRRIPRALLAAATIVGLLLVGGSARPAPPFGLRPLWSRPVTGNDVPTFGPDAGYVFDGSALTAYDLASGTIRWSTPVHDVEYGASPAGPVVLLGTEPVTVERQGADGDKYQFVFARATVALSARTGAEIWRAGGNPILTDDSTALFEERNQHGEVARLRLTRLADGATIWTHAVPSSWILSEDGGGRPDRLLTLDPTGEIKVFRYADGALVRQGRLPELAGRPPAREKVGLVPMGNLLAVVRQKQADPRETTATVYRLDDLTRLWQHRGAEFNVRPCAPVFCVLGPTDATGLDPATGRELWRRPGMRGAWPAGPGRLLLDDGPDEAVRQLVETATGRPIGPPARGRRVWSDGPAGSLLLLGRTTQPLGLTSVTLLDLTTGAQTPIGVIGAIVAEESCWAETRYLACVDDGVLTVRTFGRPADG